MSKLNSSSSHFPISNNYLETYRNLTCFSFQGKYWLNNLIVLVMNAVKRETIFNDDMSVTFVLHQLV